MTGNGSGTSVFAGYSLLLDSPLSYDGGAVARSGVSEPLILDEEVTSIAFAADGKTFAVGGGLDAIVLWDLATLRQVSVLSTGEPVATWSLVFSPTMPTLLASGELHGMVRLWDISTGEQITVPLSGHKGPVSSLAFAPDGIRLASGSYDGTIRLWNVETGQEVDQPLAGHGQAIRGVAFQNREESPLLASSSSGSVILWDVEADHRMGSELADGDTSPVSSLVFAPGDTTISAPAPLAINLWDVQHPQRLVRSIELGLDAEHDPYSLASNPMDRRVLVSGGFDGTIAFWDARTGEMLGSPLPAHDGLVWSVAFSADGKLVAPVVEDGSVRLWDVSTRTAIGPPITGYADQVDTVAFSPVDSNLLAFGGTDGSLVLWDIDTEQARATLPMEQGTRVKSLTFRPDGTWLASGGSGGTVRLWDAASGEPLGALPIENASVITAVAFSPHGDMMAAADAGGSVNLWDVDERVRIGPPLVGHPNSVLSLSFSPDGQALASGRLDGKILLWDVAVDSWRSRACQLASRNLTEEEWRHYLGSEPYHSTCTQDEVEKADTHELHATVEAVATPLATPLPKRPAEIPTVAADEVSQLVYGPADGSLLHRDDGLIAHRYAEVQVDDFVAEAQFVNPYDAAEGSGIMVLYLEIMEHSIIESLLILTSSGGSS